MSPPVRQNPTEVFYPESDGKPMAETEVHAELMVAVKQMLDERYRGRPDVHIGMDLLFYWVEGDPKRSFAPDVYVTFGMDKALRRTYKVWVEGKAPDVIFEMTSSSTRREDTVTKKQLYAQIGVTELILVDPLGDYLRPPLQGFRLGPDGYNRMAGPPLVSQVLGLRMSWQAGQLVMEDVDSGERLTTPAERAEREAERAQREAERAQRESDARRDAEARVRELEAELARLRGQR